MAPYNIISGAPSVKFAVISSVIWIIILCYLLTFYDDPGKTPVIKKISFFVRFSKKKRHEKLESFLLLCVVCVIILTGYSIFCLYVRLPGWRLTPDTDDYLLVDLHNHTDKSHDGVISAYDNLSWHYKHGYDIVVISEHNNTMGSDKADEIARQNTFLPLVLRGIEVCSDISGTKDAFMVGIGDFPALDKKKITRLKLNKQAGKFIDYIKNSDDGRSNAKGVVIALAYKLTPADILILVKEGVDGFEIANYGHPEIPAKVRRAVLNAAS